MVDESGRIAVRVKHLTPPSAKDSGEIVGAIVAAARECEQGAKEIGGLILGASVVVPGTVDVTGEIIVQAPNVPSLDKFRLSQALSEELGWQVLLENDANTASVGEMWLGAARGSATLSA